jgi:hypothetical protein
MKPGGNATVGAASLEDLEQPSKKKSGRSLIRRFTYHRSATPAHERC